MMKPYRLINTSEIKTLNQHFIMVLQQWNNEYSFSPISFNLTAPEHENSISGFLVTDEENTPLAMIEEHYLEFFNQVLFSENALCFNAASQELILILLNQLVKLEQCIIQKKTDSVSNWFYKGSTCLVLRLNCNQSNLNLFFNPNWVYQQLPQNNATQNNLGSLEEAVAKERITANLDLTPITIPIMQLMSLQIGDVIATEHAITTPLRLIQKEQLLTEAELGQSSNYKSVILKGFS